MDNYPPEFILHHVPLMAVIGLGTARDLVEQPTFTADSATSSPVSSKPQSRRSSLSANSTPRQQLSKSLLTHLTAKSQVGVWELGKSASATFHVVAVDKNHQFPPRKPMMRPPAQTHHPNMPIAHSPLSPLTQGSPVYPDGLIPPIWVRKHREILPSVVVGFYELWHRSSSDPIQEKEEIIPAPEPQGTAESIEREKDYNLAMEMNERRKSLHERGIKFSAVILLKTQNMKDQTMEERLGYIRRFSGLDTRNSFFLLTPSQHGDLQDFVINLQKSLYEHGLNYYREHGKRVKRKRTRLPSPSSTNSMRSSTIPQPLGVQGWMIRYDYKLATFAEFRQEMEAAINYYELAYNLLVDLFAPQSSITAGAIGLPIRSKRWGEARILADTINLKICKLNLYIDSPSGALAQLNKHVSTFRNISDTLGIGEDTFEYWAWLSKQYRIFGDVLEIATRSGFVIPDPATISHNTVSSDFRFSISHNPNTGSGINPTMILQHPGFYYHMAAKYNSFRRKKFLDLEMFMKKEGLELQNIPPQNILEAERNVDHSTLTIELFTKSYEQFKAQKTGRMTLYLASEIANTYLEAGKYETALKFFERIAKTYRKENWHTILESILRCSLKCAKELGGWENVLEYLVELLSDQFSMSNLNRAEIHNELMDVLFKANFPELRKVAIDMDEINSFITCRVQFKGDTTFIGAETPFQITVATQAESPPIPLRFSFLRLSFNDSYFNHYLRDKSNDEEDNAKLEWVDCKNCSQEEVDGEGLVWVKDVNLKISKGITKVFEGLIEPKESGDIQLQTISFGLLSEKWKVELHCNLKNAKDERSKRKWVIGEVDSEGEVIKPTYTILNGIGERTTIKVIQKLAKLDIQAKHSAPALLDEHYPIEITIVNLEQEEVKAFLNAEVVTDAPPNSIDSEDFITLNPTTNSSNNLKDIDIGILPAGESVVKMVYVLGKKSNFSRTLHLTVYYASTSSVPSAPPPTQGWIEKREDLRIHFVSPFTFSFNISPQSEEFCKGSSINPLERVERYLLVAKITTTSPWEISVYDIDLVMLNQANAQTRIEIDASSIEIDNDFREQVWKQGNLYHVNYLLKLTLKDIKQLDIDVGLLVIQWKRKQQSPVYKDFELSNTESTMRVPQLKRKKTDISATINIPPNPKVGQLFTLRYKIINWTKSEKNIHVTVEVNDSFVFSGYKQTHFIVPGMGEYCFKVNCFPLSSGKVKLPKVKMVKKGEFEGDDDLNIIAHGYKEGIEEDYFVIFIKPKIDV
ncbi:7506_t:CDS:10 [Funneliformis caledonium]|uniref:7506_t:CDS:1 n=1 Tax=Funneliformis caledonium TaxID=1117310 RepID=A0A9N9B1S4_9GLOM|nr:7506_t:CDS:10 [Funneliformis caledonium]